MFLQTFLYINFLIVLTHYKRRILQKYADALQVASQFYVVFVKVLIGLVLTESALTLALVTGQK